MNLLQKKTGNSYLDIQKSENFQLNQIKPVNGYLLTWIYVKF